MAFFRLYIPHLRAAFPAPVLSYGVAPAAQFYTTQFGGDAPAGQTAGLGTAAAAQAAAAPQLLLQHHPGGAFYAAAAAPGGAAAYGPVMMLAMSAMDGGSGGGGGAVVSSAGAAGIGGVVGLGGMMDGGVAMPREGFYPDVSRWTAGRLFHYMQERFGLRQPPQRHHFKLFLLKCADKRNLQQGIQLVEAFRRHHIDLLPEHTSLLVKTCCKLGEPGTALDLIRRRAQLRLIPTFSQLHTIMVRFSQDKAYDRAREVYDLMPRLAFHPNSETYGILVRTAAKCERFDDGLHLLGEASAQDARPDSGVFNIFMNALRVAGRGRDVLSVADLLLADGGTKVQPRGSFYALVAAGHALQADVHRAVDSLEKSPRAASSDIYVLVAHSIDTRAGLQPTFTVPPPKRDDDHEHEAVDGAAPAESSAPQATAAARAAGAAAAAAPAPQSAAASAATPAPEAAGAAPLSTVELAQLRERWASVVKRLPPSDESAESVQAVLRSWHMQ